MVDKTDQTASMDHLREQFHRDGFAIVRNGNAGPLLNKARPWPSNQSDAGSNLAILQLLALTPEELGILQREVDCLMNFLISENYDILQDFGGIIGNRPDFSL